MIFSSAVGPLPNLDEHPRAAAFVLLRARRATALPGLFGMNRRPTRRGWLPRRDDPVFQSVNSISRRAGKNDVHIARTRAHCGEAGHNRWDYDYSLDEVKPDLIISSYPILKQKPSIRETGFGQVSDFYQDLNNQSQFAELYLAAFSIPRLRQSAFPAAHN